MTDGMNPMTIRRWLQLLAGAALLTSTLLNGNESHLMIGAAFLSLPSQLPLLLSLRPPPKRRRKAASRPRVAS